MSKINAKQKLLQEKLELEKKLNSLNDFLRRTSSKEIGRTQYYYLKAQSKTMEDYLEILIFRIMDLEDDEEKEKYRCFKSKEECFCEMKKHKPFGWVYCKESDSALNINEITNASIRFGIYIPFELALRKYTFADDNTPFGIKQ